MSVNDDINRLVKQFLKDRRPSNGGWAEVTDDDMRQLKQIVDLLIEAKAEVDPDGDRAIEYILINRRVEYMPHFYPIKYRDQKPGGHSYANLRLAQEDFDACMREARP
jgi:hypothetical protein